MTHLALVVLAGKDKEKSEAGHLFNYLMLKIKKFIALIKNFIKRKNKANNLLNKVELYDEIDTYKIDLPYSIDSLVNSGYKQLVTLKKLLNQIKIQNQIDNFILPIKLEAALGKEFLYRYSYGGQLLFKSLLLEILQEVFLKKGIKVVELDITIVNGNSNEELYDIVKMLSSISKYITIITVNKENIREELERIYNENGLAIRVTDDFHSGLKYADCVINLGGLKEFIVNSYIKDKALIINYGNFNKNKILRNNSIINGIEINLPLKILKLFSEKRWTEYNKLNLAETFLILKICNKHGISDEQYGYNLMNLVSSEFKEDGYSIIGLIGRNGMLDLKI